MGDEGSLQDVVGLGRFESDVRRHGLPEPDGSPERRELTERERRRKATRRRARSLAMDDRCLTYGEQVGDHATPERREEDDCDWELEGETENREHRDEGGGAPSGAHRGTGTDARTASIASSVV
jgi:hypothetical protein